MTDDSPEPVRWLPVSSGRITGSMGLAVAALLAVLSVLGDLPLPWLGAAAMVAWVVWTAMLRPGIGLTSTSLVLRGLVSTTTIPLSRIRVLTVQQVLAVWVGERRYVSAAVGHTRKHLVRPTKASRGTVLVGDAAEDAIRAQMRDALPSTDPVTRAWAWVEIGLGVASVLLFAVLLVLRG